MHTILDSEVADQLERNKYMQRDLNREELRLLTIKPHWKVGCRLFSGGLAYSEDRFISEAQAETFATLRQQRYGGEYVSVKFSAVGERLS